jgi:hypothetical protein
VSFRVSDGDVTVTLDDDLERLARRCVDAVLPSVTDAMEEKVDHRVAAAKMPWPVVTGRSSEGLHRVTTLTLGSGVRVSVDTSVPYTFYIRPKSLHGAQTAWNRWVRGPMVVDRADLARTLGPVIVNALRRDMGGK